MKLYLDACLYGRPFDNQAHRSQESVEAEIVAIEGAVDFCKRFGFDIVGSAAVVMEIKKIKNDKKRQDVRDFYDRAVSEYIGFNIDIFTRAKEIREQALALGRVIRNRDSYHVAFAEAAGANFLLTSDIRLINAGGQMKFKTKVINPINFLQEFC